MKKQGIVLLRNAAEHLQVRRESSNDSGRWNEWLSDGQAIDILDGLRCVDGDELVPDDMPSAADLDAIAEEQKIAEVTA